MYEFCYLIVVNILFYSLFLLFSVVYIPILTPYLLIPYPFSSKRSNIYRLRNAIRIYMYWMIKYFARLFAKIEYIDQASIKLTPCIFVCNHRSASDAALVSLLGVDMVQVVKQWPFKIPFYGFLAKKAGYIPIMELDYNQLLSICSRRLQNGISIVSFPEGTRSDSLKQFGSAIFRIAHKNRVPIYPVCIVGSEKIPNRNFVIRPGKIIIKILEPILPRDYKKISPFILKKRVREIMKEEIDRLERGIKNSK